MKKLLYLLLSTVFLSSCGTFYLGYDMSFEKGQIEDKTYSVVDKTFDNDDIRIKLDFTKQEFYLTIENKTNERVSLIWDQSSIIFPEGVIDKLIPDGTRFINTDLTVLPTVIPPKAKAIKSFCTAKQIKYETYKYYGASGWVVKNLFPYKPKKKATLLYYYNYLLDDYLKIYLPLEYENGRKESVTLYLKIDNLKAI